MDEVWWDWSDRTEMIKKKADFILLESDVFFLSSRFVNLMSNVLLLGRQGTKWQNVMF